VVSARRPSSLGRWGRAVGVRTERLKVTVPSTWQLSAPGIIAGWHARVLRGVEVFMLRVAQRKVRERRAMVTVPLALAAALMTSLWLLVPLLIACAWWWAPSAWGWEWLEAVGRGVLTTEWGLVGGGALAAFPTARLAVLLAWVALPLALVALRGKRRRGTS
jgi:hypothetical protein